MKLTEIRSEKINDSYFCGRHESGLRVYLYPKKDSNTTYAMFGTRFGSINTKFKDAKSGKEIDVPDGIAHFLEHKLFESEEGDAFKRYAKTGASPNAFTNFDETCYHFSCTRNLKESLEILLDFVQSPYFTDQTVQKEQGIIGQEIRMYDDRPSWRVFFNLLQALYHNHPVKIDIAGSVESIAKITPELLYECYNNYYNLNNMTLCIAGKIDKDEVIKIIEDNLKPCKPLEPESIFPEEPYDVVKDRIEQKFDVSVPLFKLGFKEKTEKLRVSTEKIMQTEILLYIFASKSSQLYRKLLDKGLVNYSFDYEYFEGPSYATVIFSGESKDPDKVAQIIRDAAEEFHKNEIKESDFKRAKKAIWAKCVSNLDSVSEISDIFMNFSFAERDVLSALDTIANLKLMDVEARLEEQLDSKNSTLSIVSPIS